MKSGVVAKVESDQSSLESFENREEIVEMEDFDYISQCIQVRDSIDLPDGRTAQTGRAAIEDIAATEEISINDGDIQRFEGPDKVTKFTEFLYVPDNLMVVNSGSGKFAFQLVEANTGSSVFPVNFDLDGYIEERDDADPWKVGFYNNIGSAENGVVHGENLMAESEIGNLLHTSNKNQVGLEYNRNGHKMKTFVAESGYAEVYQPSSFDSSEFIQFLEDELAHHARIESDNA